MELSKEFWQQVKKEFAKSDRIWICNGSKTFAVFWSDKADFDDPDFCDMIEERRKPIRDFAKVFLIEKEINYFFVGSVLLFRNNKEEGSEREKKVRIDFLDYMVQSTTEK